MFMLSSKYGVYSLHETLLIATVIITFWSIVNIVYRFKPGVLARKGFKLYYGVVLVYRRKKAVKPSRLHRKISYVYIPIFIVVLILFYYTMISNIMGKIGLISRGVEVQLLIPGVNITGEQLIYFIVAIAIAAFIHEVMHASVAFSHSIGVKSIGFAIVVVLPIAFTEVDEDRFSYASTKSKIAVLAAGPTSNYLVALIALLLLGNIVGQYGIVVLDVIPGSLAESYGIKPGDILVAMDGKPLTRSLLAKYLNNNTYPGINFTLTVVSDKTVRQVTVSKPWNVTRLGIAFANKPVDYLIEAFGLRVALTIQFLVTWIYVVNLGLAVINAAPIFVSDGGRIFYELLKNKKIAHLVNAASLAILAIALYPL